MLVVDRVELAVVYQPCEMRKLDGDRTRRRKKQFHPRNEVVEVRYVRQHIVGHDQIGCVLLADSRCRLPAEKGNMRRDALLIGSARHVYRRFDAQDIEIEPPKAGEERSVIASDLDNTRIASEPKPRDDLVDVLGT